ncbi:MAG: VWA domain-containing protein [Polyangia bacterium]
MKACPRRAVTVSFWVVAASLVSSSTGAAAGADGSRHAADSDRRPGRGEAPTSPRQMMTIDIRGAVAHVAVTRVLFCGANREGSPLRRAASQRAGEGPGSEVVLDIALPPRAALLQVGLATATPAKSATAAKSDRPDDPGVPGFRARRLQVMPPARARDGYLEALRGLGLSPAEVAFDDEARLRMRIACFGSLRNEYVTLRYDYSILLELKIGVGRLDFPPAAELSPPPTRVDVQVGWGWPSQVAEVFIGGASHPQVAGVVVRATETVSTRSAWTVSVIPRAVASDGAQAPRLTSLASFAGNRAVPAGSAAGGLVAYAVGAGPGPRQALPERVLFLMDRSRSVGPGGLAVERDAARKLLEAMPPSTRFNVLFFDRTQKVLFPLPRAATLEAIAALDDEMVPAQMANGTDLVAALRQAGELMRRSSTDFAPRCLLVVVTDGAVGEPMAATDLAAVVGKVPGVELMAAAISVRANDDAAVPLPERRVLRSLVASAPLGGVERQVRAADLGDAVPALLDTLRGRGDLYGLAIHAGDDVGRRAHSKADARGSAKAMDSATRQHEAGTPITEVLESSTGVAGVLALGQAAGAAGRNVTISYRGLPRALPLRPVPVESTWIQPLYAPAAAEGRLLVGPGLAALAEPVIRPRPTLPAEEVPPSGYMERSVVRDALSLAFTPRARACYLSRTAPTAAERDLAGRVRVAMDLVRGEVADVRVGVSTLGHPGIENCLREAAYAIEVPRAYRNDEPVTAVLNLVFRPRTKSGATENPNLSREIDLIIEPALKDNDPDAGVP